MTLCTATSSEAKIASATTGWSSSPSSTSRVIERAASKMTSEA